MARRIDARAHVVPHDYGWAIRAKGKVEYHFASKNAAVQKARALAMAKGTGLVVHGRDGRIQRSWSYH